MVELMKLMEKGKGREGMGWKGDRVDLARSEQADKGPHSRAVIGY